MIAIIGLLVSLLLPALGAARESARRAVSASNMRQIGIAMQMYSDAHKQAMPPTTHGNLPKDSWVHALSEYLGDVHAVRICPADPRGSDRLKAKGTSYILNEYVAVPRVIVSGLGWKIEPAPGLGGVRMPSEAIVTMIAEDDAPLDVTNDHTHSRGWFLPNNPATRWITVHAAVGGISPGRFGGGFPHHSHGGTNFWYADGHVAYRQAVELKQQVDKGRNFAEVLK